MSALLDRCFFRAVSTGTGSFVVSLAITGFQTPAQAGAVNATVYSYLAESDDKTEWEIGTGTYTTGTTTLTRAPQKSSNTNALVNFTVPPKVGLTALAADLLRADQLVDEDNMASDSNTKVPTQQSVKAYVDGLFTALRNGVSGAFDTLAEIAADLGLKLVKSANLSDVSSAATAFSNIKQAATETATGVVELATTAEAIAGVDTSRAVTPAGVAAAIAAAPGVVLGTPFTTTLASTPIDFTTPITANTKIIKISVSGLSLAATGVVIIQLVRSGVAETSGYSGVTFESSSAQWSDGIILGRDSNAANVLHGTVTLTLLDPTTNLWEAQGSIARSNSAFINNLAGSKALSTALTGIRVTTQAGGINFDAGAKINIACIA